MCAARGLSKTRHRNGPTHVRCRHKRCQQMPAGKNQAEWLRKLAQKSAPIWKKSVRTLVQKVRGGEAMRFCTIRLDEHRGRFQRIRSDHWLRGHAISSTNDSLPMAPRNFGMRTSAERFF